MVTRRVSEGGFSCRFYLAYALTRRVTFISAPTDALVNGENHSIRLVKSHSTRQRGASVIPIFLAYASAYQ